MATQILFFTGKTKWANKLRTPDEKFDSYQVIVYLDDKNLKQFKDSGLQLKIKEDADGKYVTFKRKHVEYNFAKKEQVQNGPPKLQLKKGKELVDYPDGFIGNGSTVTVRVEAYDTPRRGAGTKGHRLLAVTIEDLIEYTPPAEPSSAVPDNRIEMPF